MFQIRPSHQRGHVDHGWLNSYHTFSFANYHDLQHMGFRSLRVINEDRVAGGQGFGTHSHQNFEIISYVVSGALQHKDSLGHTAVMQAGDLQYISAGTGISHSEFNASATEPVHFLQIWITPNRQNVAPKYDQISISSKPPSALTLACSFDGRANSLQIQQDCDLYIGRLEAQESLTHNLTSSRGAWLQLIEGDLLINDHPLQPGDGAALENVEEVRLRSENNAHFLFFTLS